MLALLLILLVLLFFGLGFTVHLLWIVAIVALVVFLVNALLGRGTRL